MNFDAFPAAIAAALAAEISPGVPSAFAGLEIMVELDDDATAEQLAAQDQIFETAINRHGIVVAIASPRAMRIDAAKAPGAVHLRLVSMVGIIENPVINRGPASGDITPAGKRPRALIREGIRACLRAGLELPENPIASPDTDLEGLAMQGFLVTAKDDIRA